MAGEWLKIFGFNFGNTSITKDIPKEEISPVTPANEDGAVTIQSTPYYGTYVDLEGSVRNEVELITRYREMSLQPELDQAIDEVINEAIQEDEEGDIVTLDLDDLNVSDQTKDKIEEEFLEILRLLQWKRNAYDIYRRWYIDGRITYHAIVNTKDPAAGMKEMRYIDPRRIRKIREIQKEKDSATGAEVVTRVNEYYLYSEKVSLQSSIQTATNLGIKIAPESIIQTNSGRMDARGQMVLSYLHKAIKPLNNLRMIEDAIVIYRLSRAPERRVFYIDVGNMQKLKADQYLYDLMQKYRNKLVYDASTGEVRDDRKHLNMMEDFWIPRRGEGKGTEITTLQAGQNLSRMEDAEFFQKKLYRALNIPIGRLNLDGAQPSIAGIGRTTEVTREELKFAKFIQYTHEKFEGLFLTSLGVQLRLKNICNDEEWETLRDDISFRWNKGNNYDELLQMDVLRERLVTLGAVDPYVGRYFSVDWVNKNILRFDEEEAEEMREQIEAEQAAGIPAMIQNAAAAQGMGASANGAGPGGGLPLSPDTGPNAMQVPGINAPGGPATDQSIPGAPVFNPIEDNTGLKGEVDRDTEDAMKKKEKEKSSKSEKPKSDKERAKTSKESVRKAKKRISKRMRERRLESK